MANIAVNVWDFGPLETSERFQTKPIMQINIIQITMKLEATWEDQNRIQIYGRRTFFLLYFL